MPDELLLSAYLVGTADMVSERLVAYADAGVDCLRLSARGRTASEQIENLEQAVELVGSATPD